MDAVPVSINDGLGYRVCTLTQNSFFLMRVRNEKRQTGAFLYHPIHTCTVKDIGFTNLEVYRNAYLLLSENEARSNSLTVACVETALFMLHFDEGFSKNVHTVY